MFDFLFEKFESAGCFEEVKEYKKTSYEDVKNDIESMLGKCVFSLTDIESNITWVKPLLTNDEYRIICYDESQCTVRPKGVLKETLKRSLG